MLDWVAEPYVTALLAPVGWVVVADGLSVCGFEEEDVWGRVNSSKKSANRAWCMWMCVAEESLLWWVVSGGLLVCLGECSWGWLIRTILADLKSSWLLYVYIRWVPRFRFGNR